MGSGFDYHSILFIYERARWQKYKGLRERAPRYIRGRDEGGTPDINANL